MYPVRSLYGLFGFSGEVDSYNGVCDLCSPYDTADNDHTADDILASSTDEGESSIFKLPFDRNSQVNATRLPGTCPPVSSLH